MRDVTPGVGSGESPAGFLRALIRAEGGSIPVERFMQEALFHPQFGYYAKRVRAVGKTGDFSTSATLHPALGQALAAWVNAHRAEVTHGKRWHLIELGGGSGELAVGILRSLGWWTRRGLSYHVVDVSEGLRAAQRDRLGGFGHAVRWHPDLRSALSSADGNALIFSNEFADAFPCVQLVRGSTPGNWREVRVCWPDDADFPREILRDWHGEVSESIRNAGLAEGQRVEIQFSYRRWLEENACQWKNGRWLTIDYGDSPAALYHRRPNGTLRAYFRQQRMTGAEIYRRFGQQDLTVDVNFADLQRWGETLGLRNESLSTQTDFLCRWLPARMIEKARDDAALAFLLDPAGAGGAFKVLEQTRRTQPS